MKRALILSVSGLFLLFVSCGISPSTAKKGKEMGDDLLEKIANKTITNEFPEDEFPPGSIDHIYDELVDKCGFNNKNGVFVNDFFEFNNGTKYLHLIYEYPTNCEDKRIMIMYLVRFGKLKLVGFGFESAENENIMIRKPERQLKNQRLKN